MSDPSVDAGRLSCARLHLRFGWWSLLVFLVLGTTLESMHGFKIGWYLDVGNETRRLMWTLAHSHGTLFAVINIVFALTLRSIPVLRRQRLASRSLLGASVVMPGGFLLGGFAIHSTDPGPGILLVPVGGLLLFLAVGLTAFSVAREDPPA